MMVRIGIDTPDTSHVRVFTEAFDSSRNFAVESIYADGSVRNREIVGDFAKTNNLRVVGSRSELAASTDAVLLLGVDWNQHIEAARTYLEFGKQLFIDKPVCGSFPDLIALRELLERYPKQIFGGSALPHTRQFKDFLGSFLFFAKSDDAEVEIYGKLDSYFMATHSYELASFLLSDTAAVSVLWGDEIEVKSVYESFTRTIRLKQAPANAEHPWSIRARVGKQLLLCPIPLQGIYDGLLNSVADHFVSGRDWSPGISVELALAAERSGKSGKPVMLTELDLGDMIPSDGFVEEYRLRFGDQAL
jgi:hypothetical protein